jgi:hypothetical protein
MSQVEINNLIRLFEIVTFIVVWLTLFIAGSNESKLTKLTKRIEKLEGKENE